MRPEISQLSPMTQYARFTLHTWDHFREDKGATVRAIYLLTKNLLKGELTDKITFCTGLVLGAVLDVLCTVLLTYYLRQHRTLACVKR